MLALALALGLTISISPCRASLSLYLTYTEAADKARAQRHYVRAEHLYREALKIAESGEDEIAVSELETATLSLADVLQQSGKRNEAVLLLKKALDSDYREIKGKAFLKEKLSKLEQSTGAEPAPGIEDRQPEPVDQAGKSNLETYQDFCENGNALLVDGLNAQAAESFSSAVTAARKLVNGSTELAESSFKLGVCYERLGKREQALAALQESLTAAISSDVISHSEMKLVERTIVRTGQDPVSIEKSFDSAIAGFIKPEKDRRVVINPKARDAVSAMIEVYREGNMPAQSDNLLPLVAEQVQQKPELNVFFFNEEQFSDPVTISFVDAKPFLAGSANTVTVQVSNASFYKLIWAIETLDKKDVSHNQTFGRLRPGVDWRSKGSVAGSPADQNKCVYEAPLHAPTENCFLVGRIVRKKDNSVVSEERLPITILEPEIEVSPPQVKLRSGEQIKFTATARNVAPNLVFRWKPSMGEMSSQIPEEENGALTLSGTYRCDGSGEPDLGAEVRTKYGDELVKEKRVQITPPEVRSRDNIRIKYVSD